MGASGFQSSMGASLKSNARLLNKNNLFNQLKEIERSGEGNLDSKLTNEELIALRTEENIQHRRNKRNRRLIGFLVIIPMSIILLSVVYLLVKSLL